MTIQANKKKLWYSNNCIDQNNLPYISKMLENKNITCWKEIVENGETALLINYKYNTYKIIVSENYMGLILMERNKANNIKALENYRRLYNSGENGIFTGDDCWYNIIEYISRNRRK